MGAPDNIVNLAALQEDENGELPPAAEDHRDPSLVVARGMADFPLGWAGRCIIETAYDVYQRQANQIRLPSHRVRKRAGARWVCRPAFSRNGNMQPTLWLS